jgi:hypothetical protein
LVPLSLLFYLQLKFAQQLNNKRRMGVEKGEEWKLRTEKMKIEIIINL